MSIEYIRKIANITDYYSINSFRFTRSIKNLFDEARLRKMRATDCISAKSASGAGNAYDLA